MLGKNLHKNLIIEQREKGFRIDVFSNNPSWMLHAFRSRGITFTFIRVGKILQRFLQAASSQDSSIGSVIECESGGLWYKFEHSKKVELI